ncbi:MAG: hypothetical protein RIQ75_2114 [Pseudomonadota bacterium]
MKKIALGLVAVLLSGTANAATIVSYDIKGATLSGFGLWAHTYNGTITPTGGSAADYAGGSGTLNDGTPGTSEGDTQLFDNAFAPVITLKLKGTYKVSSLSFLTNAPGNSIPGNLTALDVTIGGNTETISLTDFGTFNNNDFLPNDLATLGALLSNTATNKIVLSNFVSAGSFSGYFSIGEIEVAGAAAGGVPEPAAWAMMLAGFGLVGGAMRRREKTTVTFA